MNHIFRPAIPDVKVYNRLKLDKVKAERSGTEANLPRLKSILEKLRYPR